jgi:heptosyltransferase III
MIGTFRSDWKESPDTGRRRKMASPGLTRVPEVQSILVIHQGALGDFILALPALGAIRKVFPRARSAIMGYPRILELVQDRFYAEDIFSVDQKGMASFFIREGTLDLTLSQFFKAFDLIVVFGKDGEGTVIGNLRRVCQGQILSISSFPAWDEKVHLTDYLLKQFGRYGIVASESIPRLHLKASDREWARNFWKSKGVSPEERSKVIIFHPGSGSKKKVWPLDRFSRVARTLQDRLGSRMLIVLGPAEGAEARKAFEGVGTDSPFLAKGLTLLQLAAAMEGCWFFIGNDSGVSHLAAALGLPTLAIFGPTDQRVWSPRGEKTFVVCRGIHCSPCPQERFVQCKDSACLKAIEVVEVLEGLEKIGIELKS